jgi:hypothetical protein
LTSNSIAVSKNLFNLKEGHPMKASKNNYRFTAAVLGITVLLWIASALTRADVVYDTTASGTEYIYQQTGNNDYYVGDTATIVPTSQPLTTISIVFGTSSAGSAFTYTPDLTLDLYPNATDAVTQTDRFGSAEVNNVTFTNDGVVDPSIGYNYEDEQLITFDFTSQDIVLPATFAFAYHDSAPLDSNGSSDGANGFSVGLNTEPASPGISDEDAFATYPNTALDPADETLDLTDLAGTSIEAQINVVPEPASLSLIGLGAPLLLRRRRRA